LNRVAGRKRKGKSIFNIANNQLTTLQRMKQSHPTSHRKEDIQKKKTATTMAMTTATAQFYCWMNPGIFGMNPGVFGVLTKNVSPVP